ncbi:DUF4065 domain-containing protein [Thalassospira tepidiphila]|jgi:uncharacterized phage-associated protein|uniref:type VI toxin-antitoxin system SocA family antitoxin n=1 Tax=Thalassospira tepidiphila TaxID=393657 RepID=UPI001BCBFAA7|nr:Panacea domain-containing protein [Thalassospira tepidiphila]MBS8274405.1 DUF4065 domain-containing protein [Thalassospira tepidiphila]
MNQFPFDPRCISNMMLDEADRRDIAVTNLALQKLLYFAHGIFLGRQKRPLVSGHFEAWQHGPVNPVVYHAFKAAKAQPIDFRAKSRDLLTGKEIEIAPASSREVQELLENVLHSYGRLTAGQLVAISHAKNGPWDYIVNKSRTSIAIGLKIPDNVIVDKFKFHKSTVDSLQRQGEPIEDSPFA